MAEIAKFISKDIGDLGKMFGVAKSNLSTVINIDMPSTGASWYSRYTWNSCFSSTHECVMGVWAFSMCSNIYVPEVGTWSEGYRPTKVRITHNGTGTGLRIYIRDKNNALVGDSGDNYVSGTEIDLTWGAQDLKGFYIDNFDTFGITFSNVEWQSDSEPSACDGS
jgi:hypothetical protein